MNIRQIDIIHHSHFSLGGTDHPSVVTKLHKKYIDQALAAIESTKERPVGERFCWTAEAFFPVGEWLRDADKFSKKMFFEAVENGQLEICGMPFNLSPFYNEDEIEYILKLLPEELWKSFNINSAMLVQAGGVSASAMISAAKKGVKYMCFFPEKDTGYNLKTSQFVFNWRMTPTEKMFCFCGDRYNNASVLFEKEYSGNKPLVADLNYRQPGIIELLGADGRISKDAVIRAYVRLRTYLDELIPEDENYLFSIFPMSLTNLWREENDPLMTGLSDFVFLWNEMGLEPKLRLTTPGKSLAELEIEALNNKLPSYAGDWVSYDTKRQLSSPVEISLSRKAKKLYRSLKYISSPEDSDEQKALEKIIKNICLYDEQTTSDSAGLIDFNSEGPRGFTFAKNNFLYKALADAEYFYSEKLMKNLKSDNDGVFVYNPGDVKMCDWVVLPADSVKGKYISFMDKNTMSIEKIYHRNGQDEKVLTDKEYLFSGFNGINAYPDDVPRKKMMFWAEIPAHTARFFAPMTIAENKEQQIPSPEILCDLNGWPLKITYENGKDVSAAAFADFISVRVKGFNKRYTMSLIEKEADPIKREELKAEYLKVSYSEYDTANVEDFENCMIIEQTFSNDAVKCGRRRMQIWKKEPRVRIIVDIMRPYSTDPEAYFLKFELNSRESAPVISNGGQIFEPYRGQIEGSCTERYAIDGWVDYPYVGLMWASKDAPVISFGSMNLTDGPKDFPRNTGDIYSHVFNNMSSKNIVSDSHGKMSFQYDLIYGENFDDFAYIKKLADSLSADPKTLVSF